MTSAFLAGDVAQDEGLRLTAYPDPISPRGEQLAKVSAERCRGWQTLPGEPFTIGYGHTGPEVHEGLVWTLEQARRALEADLAVAMASLDRHEPWWRGMSDLRQDVLAGLCFNLGYPRLSGFKKALAAMESGDFRRAADELLSSRWASQVGHRATRLADQMRTGLRDRS